MNNPNPIPTSRLEGKLLSPNAADAPNITTRNEKINETNLLNLVLKNGFSRFFQIMSLGGGASMKEM